MTTGTVEGEFIATMEDPDDPEMFERNRIHTTAGAQEYGFKGAFVGGVTLYAWCVPTIVEALGEAWLDEGWINVRFRRPTYPGAAIKCRWRAKDDGPGPAPSQAVKDDGETSIVGEVGLGPRPGWATCARRRSRPRSPTAARAAVPHPGGRAHRPAG